MKSFNGMSTDGRVKLWPHEQERYNAEIARLDGKPVVLMVKCDYDIRSVKQNAYVWGVMYRYISEHTGLDIEDVHEYCKSRFNAKRVVVMEIEGKGEVAAETIIGGSTTKMTTQEMSRFIDNVLRWAASGLGVNIPLPNQVDWLE